MTGPEDNAAAARVLDVQSGVQLDESSAARIFAHWAADGRFLQDAVRTIGKDAFFDMTARRFNTMVGR